jgi:hypothetical protein
MKTGNEETLPEEKLDQELNDQLGDDVDEEDGLSWMADESDGDSDEVDESGNSVPVATHVKVKHKLKAKIGEKDELIATLREENEQLKVQPVAPMELNPPKRPRASDFGTDDEFETAMDSYEDQNREFMTKAASHNTVQTQKVQQQENETTQAVDDHYTRAETLVQENSINPDVFKKTDLMVKSIIESVMPKAGEQVFNHLVSLVGDGSEKTMFFLGRNKAAQHEFHSLLAQDKTGLKAALYLGRITERIGGAKNQSSRSPKPATNLQGDVKTSAQGSALYRKWANASGKDPQKAYNLKKEAKAKGIDTSSW